MAVDTQEANIFSITPPPSDFDEFDQSGLLTCSPSLVGFTYPSPAPSSRDHASSVSSDSLFMLPGLSAMSGEHRSHSHDLQHLNFDDATSSDSASFFPIAPVTDPSMAFGHTSTSGAGANSYNMYEQTNWFQFPNYSQPTPMMPYEPTHSTSYDAFSSTHPSMANIIPPTPQDIQPTPFDFNAPPALASNGHLVASPSFSHASHRSRGSISSLSRSCSPIPHLSKSFSSDSTMLRPNIRSQSTSSTSSLHQYGIPVAEAPSMMPTGMSTSSAGSPTGSTQAWRCAYPGCTSRATFTRGCDLRKHYNRHSKHLFCRVDGCPQSEAAAASRAKSADQPLAGGFSSKKDRARHEAKHSPSIKCEWRGPDGEECPRVFSRMDNMKDHVRRIHRKDQSPQQQQQKPSHAQSSSRK
ncbi:hypothetical protein PV05_03464 [Exophiala xenobiotica]|uniref:C2H2-type domain-containing protein n=1 Tax=Exophiala xenobiotica TaxID=348802 RepID=A0A0D2C2F3_9EURO|nr:uncharacterized protein PV05_03464 [Exophiala xenobiotica]KIW58976.1 hypothetical protein PV05_03464 [Exophiala xenobiotica]